MASTRSGRMDFVACGDDLYDNQDAHFYGLPMEMGFLLAVVYQMIPPTDHYPPLSSAAGNLVHRNA